MRITSRSNGRIKEIIKLMSSGRFRAESGLFVVEGMRLCADAMQSDISFRTLIISDTAAEKHTETVKELEHISCETITLPDSLFDTLSDTKSPQGIMAVCEKPNYTATIKTGGKYIALENLSDPANLGTISRTAEAIGLDALILSNDSCDPYSPKALRAGMGSLFRIPVIITDDFIGDIKSMKESGFRVYAAVVQPDALSIKEADFSGGLVAIIGNEGNGLTDEVKSAASAQVTIPMKGRSESLNAAAAASILIWEMFK